MKKKKDRILKNEKLHRQYHSTMTCDFTTAVRLQEVMSICSYVDCRLFSARCVHSCRSEADILELGTDDEIFCISVCAVPCSGWHISSEKFTFFNLLMVEFFF